MQGCYDAEKLEQPDLKFTWDPEIAIPIGTTSLSISNWVLDLPVNYIVSLGITSLELQDTLPVNLQDFTMEGFTIKSVEFKCFGESSYNSTIDAQIYFTDSFYIKSDSVFSEGPKQFDSATVTENCDIVEKADIGVVYTLDQSTYENVVNNTRYVIIKYILNIEGFTEQNILCLTGSEINVSLGMKINVEKKVGNN